MNRDELLQRIRVNGLDVIAEFLPAGPDGELKGLMGAHRHEVHAEAFRMFLSVRALLRENGMPSVESDCEAGQIMARLSRCAT